MTSQPTRANPVGARPDAAEASSACGAAYWRSRSDAEWRRRLTPEQYRIARQAGTERAFTGRYWNSTVPGLYRCACCGAALFHSESKFESGTGWPSFKNPITPQAVVERVDHTGGLTRTEVQCGCCGAHLGHVFDDGPPPTQRRYCLNSAVLELAPASSGTGQSPLNTSSAGPVI